MKRIIFILTVAVLLSFNFLMAQGEASAIFLLIAPGSRAEAMGEAQVANSQDAYSSYWNPAGMAFMPKSEIGLMHANWLKNLGIDDMYYDVVTGGVKTSMGTFGGHIIYLNLGEQQRTSPTGMDMGTFRSYLTATTLSYGTKLSKNSAIGINTKVVYQKLTDKGTVQEEGTGSALHFAFDVGYQKRRIFSDRVDFGMALSNIGPKVTFIDEAQADPQPTNLKLGFNFNIVDQQFHKFSVVTDMNKMLVASHPSMDIDGDHYISDSEEGYTDPLYKAIFTSWTDDWKYDGDIDYDGNGKIGGFTFNDISGTYEADTSAGSWGDFNERGKKEVGSKDDGSFQNEIDEMIFNVGMEYAYNNLFFLRAGFAYDKAGDIKTPTLGFGILYHNIGADFGYTSAEEGHPLANTMRFSLRFMF
ncbi:MAG: PorV/PorQ family protein [Candidatus Marinimicrobia bacterium]|nr:PorV/PorQ family protein [Candidatus Neomarinimicrobiota bacterium]